MSKTILITGGSRGIGAAAALLAAEKGYAVSINYLSNKPAADNIVETIKNKGGTAISVAGDVATEEDVLTIFKETEEKLGNITALVNNAGIVQLQSLLQNITVKRWDKIFATNARGSFLCAREAIKRMSIKNGGSGGGIINLSSVAAKLGGAFEYIDYAASKAAIDILTIGLAKEVAADGIRVNAVRPGIIYTEIHASGGEPNRPDRMKDMIPMKRPGNAEEVAEAIMWLLSESASYITGTIVDVTGGR
jgi:NAD(P)-dependent dehydrogenase (short-subunit alcohol dehydrogenase family)